MYSCFCFTESAATLPMLPYLPNVWTSNSGAVRALVPGGSSNDGACMSFERFSIKRARGSLRDSRSGPKLMPVSSSALVSRVIVGASLGPEVAAAEE